MSEEPSRTIAALAASHRLHDLAVSPTGFAFDPRSGQSFTINATGVFVLDQLRAGCGIEETTREIVATYGIPAEVARSAVEAFVRQLARSLP